MPNSVTSVKVLPWQGSSELEKSVRQAGTLGELLDLVPAIFRPRTQILVNKVYKAAIKSNHARSYLSTLERHAREGTFPPEIGGRIHPPALQISKEYDASAEWRSHKSEIDSATLNFKKTLLATAITVKRSEVAFLQLSFSEKSYEDESSAIFKDVISDLGTDADIQSSEDGSFGIKNLPDWIKADAEAFGKIRTLFPKRAVALAFITVQSENTRKLKSLSLKRKADTDIEMQDVGSQNQTVDALVSRKVEALLKEFKIQKPSNLLSFSVFKKDQKLTNSSRQEEEIQSQSQTVPAEEVKREGKNRRRGQEKREERRQEISKEVSKLERAFSGTVQAHLRVSTCGGVESGCQTILGSPVSELRRRDRAVVSTAEAVIFLEKHAELFSGVSTEARQLFVSKHTPVSLFELGHQFDDGVFKGPGVNIPKFVEYKLALNTKFVLHHSPNLLRVHQAWPTLERSVRIRWHFRNTDRIPSKFFVPKPNWEPPMDKRDVWIERGLERGKELLFNRTALLNPHDTHASNPDVRSLFTFLQSSSLLVKVTDKNLGLAVLSKEWYIEQCRALLADMTTYESISDGDLEWYRRQGLRRIASIINRGRFNPSTTEYLSTSIEDTQVPEFHAIPKVHKTPWKLRPIIPSHSWFSRKASEVCDFTLRECISRRFPWIVDSTKQVISLLQDKTVSRNDNIWLVTGDVEAFYTNVDIPETINTIRTKTEGFVHIDGYNREDIADLLDVIMNCNCFRFNEESFKQSAGIAMGTSCAPAFANLNLAFKEDKIAEILATVVNNEDGLIFYVRYIDDIFFIYKGAKASLQSLLAKFNKQFEPFKIGWNIHSTSMATVFLDVEFFFEQGLGPIGVQSKVYRKKMNKHQYIPWSSAHPVAVKKAFVKAELTRFMVISSSSSLYEERVLEFQEALLRRGYVGDTLRHWMKMVKYEDRQIALLTKKLPGNRGLPLMLPSSYDEVWEYTDLRSIFRVMMEEWANVGEPLPESLRGPLIKSLRRTENMFDKYSAWNKAILKALTPIAFRSLEPRKNE